MNKTLGTAFYYLIALTLILIIGRISPTNLAGPGFDLVVYIVVPIISLGLLAKSMIRGNPNSKIKYQLLAVNLIGSIAVILIVIHEMTKKN
jgi:hypothetical protein